MIAAIRFLSILILLSFVEKAIAQTPQYAFLVNFTDKNPTTFTLNNPQAYLSTRAIDRRTKYNIAIDSTDLPVIDAYVDSVLSVTQGVLHIKSRWMNSAVILIPDSTSILQLANISFVSGFKKVAYYPVGLHQRGIPIESDTLHYAENEPDDFDQNYYGDAWTQIDLCDGPYMHNLNYRGENMLIAVIDEGFKGANTIHAFDSLIQENRVYDTKNFVYNTDSVFIYNDHGTKVLSTMAALIPQSYVGVAPKASYALYISEDGRTEQIIEESNLLAAAERADSIGADVITTSVGYNYFNNTADSHTHAELDGHTTIAAKALNAAVSKGILAVASAGNEALLIWHNILTPGDADSALTVGAVGENKISWTGSSFGPNADGVLKPDVSAMGYGTALVDQDGDIVTNNGTSLSTPIIAGLSACLMQALPMKTPYEIRRIISESCDSFNYPSYQRGYGVPDFRKILDSTTTAIHQPVVSNNTFTVFPNPAMQYVSIKGNGKMMYSILDMQGRTLMQGITAADKKINVGGLSKGIYLIRISNDKASESMKLHIE